MVVAVNIDTLEERILATGRQLAWGQPTTDTVPIYGPHWNPGVHRDLELLNVETGDIRTVVTAAEVMTTYPSWISQQFSDREISIFFPVPQSRFETGIFLRLPPLRGEISGAKKPA